MFESAVRLVGIYKVNHMVRLPHPFAMTTAR